MRNHEKPQASREELSILNQPDFKDFIESRKIESEDIELLENLSRFPKSFFNKFHNFFNLSKERSVYELENQLKSVGSQQEQQKEFLELLSRFTKKYDWPAAYNLIRVLERLKQQK